MKAPPLNRAACIDCEYAETMNSPRGSQEWQVCTLPANRVACRKEGSADEARQLCDASRGACQARVCPYRREKTATGHSWLYSQELPSMTEPQPEPDGEVFFHEDGPECARAGRPAKGLPPLGEKG